MNILITTDTVGGVWTYVLELIDSLTTRDVTFTVASMGPAPTPEQRAEMHRRNVQLVESTYRLEWMQDPWDDVARAGDWLLGLEQRVRPDIVHLNGFVHAALPWRAPAVVVAHSCVCSWWSAVRRSPLAPEFHRYRTEVARGLRAASLVVAPSAAMLSAVEEQYGQLRSCRVIHNGRTAVMPAGAIKEPVVISSGRVWDEAKNFATLDRAAPQIDWPVCVAGADECAGQRVSLQNVQLLGALCQSALRVQLARASIFALPVRYEPFGFGPVEAALAGCALVLGDIPSMRELWGRNAAFVDADDAEALAARVNALIRDPRARDDLARRARMRALAFSPARMAQEYLSAYRQLLRAEVHACAS